MESIVTEAHAWAVSLVLAAIALDCLSGVAKGASKKELSSSKMRQGLWHKAGELLVLVLAVLLEVGSAHLDLGFSVPLVIPACAYLVLNEALSVAENICELSPELRDSKVMRLLGHGDGEEGKDEG